MKNSHNTGVRPAPAKRHFGGRRNQGGFSLIELLIAGVVFTVIAVVVYNSVISRQDSTYEQQLVQLAEADASNCLATVYYQNARSYAVLASGTVPDTNLVQCGMNQAPPTGNWFVSTAGTAAGVTITYSTTQARVPATTCQQAATQVTADINSGAVKTATSATCAAGATDLVVAYTKPT